MSHLLDSAVTNLGKSDFTPEGNLTKKRSGLVLFYAPWCIHCQHLAPVFNQFVKDNAEKGKLIGAVNGQDQEELMQRIRAPERVWKYQIPGFPTMVGFEKGKYVGMFAGPRTSAALTEYLLKLK